MVMTSKNDITITIMADTTELELELAKFILANPHRQYDYELMRQIFPKPATLDNFGIKSEAVRKVIRGLING